MSHGRLERQLSAYLDGELSADDAAEVRLHLSQCPRCQREVERLQVLKQVLGALPERDAPVNLWVSVREQLQQPRSSLWERWMESLRTLGLGRRPVAAAAAVAVVLVLIAVPLVRGRLDRLRAADLGVDVYLREHVLVSSGDPFADRSYLGLVIGDSNLALIGEPRRAKEER